MNTKQMFKVYNGLLGRCKEPSLPSGFMNQELADNFNEFFINKITNIRSNFPNEIQDHLIHMLNIAQFLVSLRIFDFLAVMK